MHTEVEAIVEAALLVRRSIEPGLTSRPDGTPASTGACLYGSVLAATVLSRFDFGTATVRGGDGDQDGGAMDATGQLRGHYWVELDALDGQCYVVDVTADQFGHPPVRVISVREAADAGQYRPGSQALVDEHVADAKQRLAGYAASVTA